MLSLGSGHGDLIMTISQIKELRSATKALIAAEEATLDDLVRWSAKEENRAIKDVLERFSELCAFWTEAQKELNEQMKEVRSHFEVMHRISALHCFWAKLARSFSDDSRRRKGRRCCQGFG